MVPFCVVTYIYVCWCLHSTCNNFVKILSIFSSYGIFKWHCVCMHFIPFARIWFSWWIIKFLAIVYSFAVELSMWSTNRKTRDQQMQTLKGFATFIVHNWTLSLVMQFPVASDFFVWTCPFIHETNRSSTDELNYVEISEYDMNNKMMLRNDLKTKIGWILHYVCVCVPVFYGRFGFSFQYTSKLIFNSE